MADLLSAAKTVRSRPQDGEEDDILKPLTSRTKKSAKDVASNVKDTQAEPATRSRKATASSPQDVLGLLQSQPDVDVLLLCLKQLRSQAFRPAFDIHVPGPLQAQIINTLLSTVLPDFWQALRERHSPDFIECLRNVAGLNAVFARLRLLCSGTTRREDSKASPLMDDVLELAGFMLQGDLVLLQVHSELCDAVADQVKRNLAWKELVNLVGSGKIPSTLAQAEDISGSPRWKDVSAKGLADGRSYATWLGRNIATLASAVDESRSNAAALVLSKATTLGHMNQVIDGFLGSFAQNWTKPKEGQDALTAMIQQFPSHSKRYFVELTLRWSSSLESLQDHSPLQDAPMHNKAVSTLASLLALITSSGQECRSQLTALLTDPVSCSTMPPHVRRACVLVVARMSSDSSELQTMLENTMTAFNDHLFIKHAPIIQQEAMAHTILLASGVLHRQMPMALLMTARSSNHMQGVSNRLDSSNLRARWLGMVVGTSLSSLVDKEGAKMSFGTDDMTTEDAKWYMSLVKVEDQVGHLADIPELLEPQDSGTRRSKRRPVAIARNDELPKIDGKQTFGPPRPPAQTEVIGEKVTEVVGSDEDEEDDDLKPYAKPDSDREDSDEDATLVNRKKAKVPVYVRDLMAMLRDDQNHDRFQLGINSAAALLRRKMNFGSEVKDHAEEIGVILCNLRDPFDTDDFDNLKLQAMIAVILSDVKVLAPWFCKQAFLGDYSIAQRCIILSAIGLSGRELAGLEDEDELNPKLGASDFPTKRLPPRLHAMYDRPNSSVKRLDAAGKDVEQALIKPMALQAADQSTAHLNAVKVRTFSSRMETERTKRKPAPNALARVFGEFFFLPLVNRYQQETAAYGSSSVFVSVSFVLVTLVKTLAILLHASGPATLGLSELSGEFWDLLLSLRVQASQDVSILHAVLFALLTVLELNADKSRVVQEHPKRLMETQQWVELIFDRMGGNELMTESNNEEEHKVKMLAAGVLVKTKEIIDGYQKELIGYSF